MEKEYFNSYSLAEFLKKEGIEFKIHEFESEVKTVEDASKKVPLEKIIKTLVLIDSEDKPLIVILKASKKLSLKKLKKALKVKDVRFAKPEEVLKFSGYEAGAVPPCFWKDVKKVIVDLETSKMEEVFAGGGDKNKLLEMKMEDLIKLNSPLIADVSE
ncbi:MAG: YbaK/EbsC family protein [Candidatus Aenigmatarchaeota archaeon]